jgi:hypothetical protein
MELTPVHAFVDDFYHLVQEPLAAPATLLRVAIEASFGVSLVY